MDNIKLINLVSARRVLIDDITKGLYRREAKLYYTIEDPMDHNLVEEKIFYVFKQEGSVHEMILIYFLDKFGQEWTLLLKEEVRGFTHQGVPITMLGRDAKSTSRGEIPILRPMQRVSFFENPIFPRDERMRNFDGSMGPSAPKMPRLTNSIHMHEYRVSGDPAHEESRKMPFTPMFSTPDMIKGFSFGKSFFESSRKMIPSHFQKWVKKYSGIGDPYNQLATFKQIVRAEQISNLHTLVEGFGLTLEGKALSWF